MPGQTQGNAAGDTAAREPKATKAPPKTADPTRDADKEARPEPVTVNVHDHGPAGDSEGSLDVSASVAEVTGRIEAENAVGYRGARMDPTPLHAYTLEGVANEEPTPETDEDAKVAALDRARTPAEELHELAAEQQEEAK